MKKTPPRSQTKSALAKPPSRPAKPRLVTRAEEALCAQKAEDLVLIDLRGLSTVADWFLVASCRSEAQIAPMLSHVRRALQRDAGGAVRTDCEAGVRWGVLYLGELLVHVFERGAREFYSLERLWADAPMQKITPAGGGPALKQAVADDLL